PGLVTDAVTVSPPVPLCPSLVAVIMAAPAATPVTSPLPFTVATAGAVLAHVTTRPATAFPLASFGVAVSCTVCPTAILPDAGLTATVDTGADVNAVVPLATFESPPNTVLGVSSSPRNATTRNWDLVATAGHNTVHVRFT